jgi:hypothetical protein
MEGSGAAHMSLLCFTILKLTQILGNGFDLPLWSTTMDKMKKWQKRDEKSASRHDASFASSGFL